MAIIGILCRTDTYTDVGFIIVANKNDSNLWIPALVCTILGVFGFQFLVIACKFHLTSFRKKFQTMEYLL